MSDPGARFYNDLDAETTARCLAEIAPYQAKPTIFTPVTYEAYRDVPSTYLFCEKDAAMPFDLQKAMVTTAGEDLIKSYTCGAGHLPMLGTPQIVFDVIDKPLKTLLRSYFEAYIQEALVLFLSPWGPALPTQLLGAGKYSSAGKDMACGRKYTELG